MYYPNISTELKNTYYSLYIYFNVNIEILEFLVEILSQRNHYPQTIFRLVC